MVYVCSVSESLTTIIHYLDHDQWTLLDGENADGTTTMPMSVSTYMHEPAEHAPGLARTDSASLGKSTTGPASNIASVDSPNPKPLPSGKIVGPPVLHSHSLRPLPIMQETASAMVSADKAWSERNGEKHQDGVFAMNEGDTDVLSRSHSDSLLMRHNASFSNDDHGVKFAAESSTSNKSNMGWQGSTGGV